jgi:hypothetical protein
LWNYKAEEDEVGWTCGKNGEKKNVYRLLIGKPEGKRPLGRPRRRWRTGLVWLRIGTGGKLS